MLATLILLCALVATDPAPSVYAGERDLTLALALIRRHEGLRLCVYRDPRVTERILTIGYGHTGSDVKPGMCISRERAEELLMQDARHAASIVARNVRVQLSDAQFSALTSFVFNIGAGAFARSTLLRLLNRGAVRSVPAQMRRWVHAGGKPPVQLPGLVRRREDEAALFELGTPPDAGPTS